jgi:hypothetical protein
MYQSSVARKCLDFSAAPHHLWQTSQISMATLVGALLLAERAAANIHWNLLCLLLGYPFGADSSVITSVPLELLNWECEELRVGYTCNLFTCGLHAACMRNLPGNTDPVPTKIKTWEEHVIGVSNTYISRKRLDVPLKTPSAQPGPVQKHNETISHRLWRYHCGNSIAAVDLLSLLL